jgi:predicted O-linked N-acetylglucosamine transferase (SPINDLY family)
MPVSCVSPRPIISSMAGRLPLTIFKLAQMKPGRNEPCSCGSGKKFKHCCEGKLSSRSPTPSPSELNQLIALFNARRFTELQERAQKLVAIHPDTGVAWKLLGAALQMQGKPALQALQMTAKLMPADVDAQFKLAVASYQLGRIADAEDCYRRIADLRPDSAEAHNNYSVVLAERGKWGEAAKSVRRAIRLKPDYAEAYNNLGNYQKKLGQFEEALASYRTSTEANPNNYKAYGNLGNLYNEIGDLDSALDSYRRALDINPDLAEAYSNMLLAYNYASDYTPEFCRDQAISFGKRVSDHAPVHYADWSCEKAPTRLRVGLVSGDLRVHSVGHFLESFLSHIDQARIEFIAYPTYHKEDDLTQRIRPFFSAWRPLYGLNDAAAARLIHDDGVHVLIDASGHTSNNRLPVFACKPSPVQVTWLGIPYTTGLSEIDYVLGDGLAIPPEHEVHFSEKVWRLPESCLCLTPPAYPLKVSELPAKANGYITFGSFNNLTKMNDDVVAHWARILQSVPDAILYLKCAQLTDERNCKRTRQRFLAIGIGPERLRLAGRSTTIPEHLAEYGSVDIALDTFPYPGVTTSFEALWMGVPVLTLAGDRFLSLTAKSVACNAGLADWVAADRNDLIRKAAEFASDTDELSALRARLREQVLASPLFDAPRFARNFQQALWEMWRQHTVESVQT